ncbi:MAG: periplasmic heavy metal sensor [Silicimonas sp.]|nr:periplasmic heavy metal sensor [Silicimonas sp.]
MSETPKKRRWLIPLLIVSLALNLAVAGAILGREFSPDKSSKRDRISGPVRSVIGAPFFRALDKDDRRALIRELREEGPRIRENRESLRLRLEAFLSALRSEPFDADEVRRLMGDQRSVAQGRQELGEMLLLNRLQDMSTEERAAYADRLEDGIRNFRRKRD